MPALPADAIVVIAGRDRPDTGWSRSGWEHVTCVLGLVELAEAAALQLLEGHGVPAAAAREITGWAAGSPLALVLAADAYLLGTKVLPRIRAELAKP